MRKKDGGKNSKGVFLCSEVAEINTYLSSDSRANCQTLRGCARGSECVCEDAGFLFVCVRRYGGG